MLNVDGYEILTFSRNENRIELNVAKLKRQFDLDITLWTSAENDDERSLPHCGKGPCRSVDSIS